MSDQQPLSVKETFDMYNSALRLVGAANATGAIAAGVAFQPGFPKKPKRKSVGAFEIRDLTAKRLSDCQNPIAPLSFIATSRHL